jgi:hypothetical protein
MCARRIFACLAVRAWKPSRSNSCGCIRHQKRNHKDYLFLAEGLGHQDGQKDTAMVAVENAKLTLRKSAQRGYFGLIDDRLGAKLCVASTATRTKVAKCSPGKQQV